MQQKTQRPVQFEINEQTREAGAGWIRHARLRPEDFLFPSRVHASPHLSTRQYARIVRGWIRKIGLDAAAYGTHTLRRTKASLIYVAPRTFVPSSCYSGTPSSGVLCGTLGSRWMARSRWPSRPRSRTQAGQRRLSRWPARSGRSGLWPNSGRSQPERARIKLDARVATNMRRLLCSISALLALLRPAISVAYDSNSRSASDLISLFQKTTHQSWQQFNVARQIVALRDPMVLPQLSAYLNDQDRHTRADAAFIFAALGDTRGLDVLLTIRDDQSNRPEGQDYPGMGCITQRVGDACPYHPQLQIAEDRYYATYVLGTLRDPRAVPALISVLSVPTVNLGAIWALAEIGDKRAVDP